MGGAGKRNYCPGGGGRCVSSSWRRNLSIPHRQCPESASALHHHLPRRPEPHSVISIFPPLRNRIFLPTFLSFLFSSSFLFVKLPLFGGVGSMRGLTVWRLSLFLSVAKFRNRYSTNLTVGSRSKGGNKKRVLDSNFDHLRSLDFREVESRWGLIL